MIVKEFYKTRTDGINLYKTYSDQELKIQNEIYSSTIDVEDAPFEYVETDLPIEKFEMAISNAVEE